MGPIVFSAGVLLLLLGAATLLGSSGVASHRQLRSRPRSSGIAYLIMGAVAVAIGGQLLRAGV